MVIDNLSSIQKNFLTLLLRFKAISWLVYKYIDKNKNIRESIAHRENYPQWLNVRPDSALDNKNINAFYNNIKSLVQIAKYDSAHVILMQMPYLSLHQYYKGIFGKAIKSHNQFLEDIGKELAVPLVRTKDMDILSNDLTDIIHLDSLGNSKKGSAVGKVIAENMLLK